MRQYQTFLILWLTLLAGCSGVQPKTPDQALFAAWGTYTAVNNTTADLLIQGSISVERAESIQTQLKAYRTLLNASQGIIDGGGTLPDDNLQRLRLMQSVLIEIQKELLARQK